MASTDRDAALDDAATLGAGWVRADLAWSTVQAAGPGSYDWSAFDALVTAGRSRGLTVLPVLAWAPAWARPAGSSWNFGPTDPALFAAFCGQAAARYASQGVHTFEVWNEPNLPGYWAPKPDPAAYGRLLAAASASIKQANPGAQVIFGGMAASRPTIPDGLISPQDFLTAACVVGAHRVVDAIGFHPYTYPQKASPQGSWWLIAKTATSLRSILTYYGAPFMPVWVTEYGAPTGGPGPVWDGTGSAPAGSDHTSEAWQAAIATDVVSLAAADPNVAVLIWYSGTDLSATDQTTPENWFGYRRADGTAKPAFAALQAAITALPR